MDRSFGILALGLCLTGCATNNAGGGLGKFVGQDIQVAMIRLGNPDGQPTMNGGDKDYVWTSSPDVEVTKEQSLGGGQGPASAHGAMASELGGGSGHGPGGAGGGGSMLSTYTTTEIVHLKCTIRLATDQNDRIKSYNLSGDLLCSKYYALNQRASLPKSADQTAPGSQIGNARSAAEIYGALPLASDARLSPDGNFLALVSGASGSESFVIWPINGDPPRVVQSTTVFGLTLSNGRGTVERSFPKVVQTAKDFEPISLLWKGNDRLVGNILMGDLASRYLSVDRSGQNTESLYFDDGRVPSTLQIISGSRDPDHILAVLTPVGDVTRSKLSRMDLRTGLAETLDESGQLVAWQANANGNESVEVRPASIRVAKWLADVDGKVRLCSVIQDPNQRMIYVRAGRNSDWMLIHKGAVDTDPVFEPLAFSSTDPKLLYVAFQQSDGHMALGLFNTIAGRMDKIIAAKSDAEVDPVTLDGTLIGYRIGPEVTYLDEAWNHDAAVIRNALPGYQIDLIGRSEDGKRALARVVHGNEPSEFWLLDRRPEKPDLHPILVNYDAVAPDQVAQAQLVHYPARDGLMIPALLTLPKGGQPGPIPFIVLPHDGLPENRPEFAYLPQFLSHLGYGVLQPQFRGSSGYGLAFERAGLRQWGAHLQEDIVDGTKWLIETGHANPKRICIAGISYGGYAALMAATKEPGLYRCAAALAPITDPGRLDPILRQYFFHGVDLPWLKLDDQASDGSLINLAGRMETPVLLVHGRRDFVVPVGQTGTLEHALIGAGKKVEALYQDKGNSFLNQSGERSSLEHALKGSRTQVEVVYLEEGDSFLNRAADRVAFLTALQSFLAKTLPTGLTVPSEKNAGS